MNSILFGSIVLIIFIVIVLLKTAVIVPEGYEYIVERLGKYHSTLQAGFHILTPFFDQVAYNRNLKEQAIDLGSQIYVTADNNTVAMDSIMHFQVVNSRQSVYGVEDYHLAASQLAQTSLHSVIGKINEDKVFEFRDYINQQVTNTLNQAAKNWGVKILRCEIKEIQPLPSTGAKAITSA